MFWLGVTISLDFATNLELLFAAYVRAEFFGVGSPLVVDYWPYV